MDGVAVINAIASAGILWALVSSDVLLLMKSKGYDLNGGECSGSCGQAAFVEIPAVPPDIDETCQFPATFPCEME